MSETTKHTPGPWKAEVDSSTAYNVWVILNSDNELIADVFGNDEVDEANAKLLASAPALAARVEALEGAVRKCLNILNQLPADYDIDDVYAALGASSGAGSVDGD